MCKPYIEELPKLPEQLVLTKTVLIADRDDLILIFNGVLDQHPKLKEAIDVLTALIDEVDIKIANPEMKLNGV